MGESVGVLSSFNNHLTSILTSGALAWGHPLKERLRLNSVMFLVACIYSGT